MKKILIAICAYMLTLSTSVSADIGVNVGVSGQMGVFVATAKETETGPSITEKSNGSEHGAIGFASIFIEKTLGDRLAIGIDYVPSALDTETTETSKRDKTTSDTQSSKTNKLQVDFEDLTTYYLSLNVTDNAYIRAGIVTVDVITNEDLGTGSTYGNTDLDGTLLGVGFSKDLNNGKFVRVEGNYMDFDGASLTSQNNSDNKITLNSLEGVSGKISFGKTF